MTGDAAKANTKTHAGARNRLVTVGGALATGVLLATAATSFAASSQRAPAMAAEKAQVTILSPSQGSATGAMGWDMQVRIVVPARYAKAIPATPAFTTPTSPYFKPGPSHAFPGLVVTDTGTAAKLGGGARNLAGLFQVIGVSKNFAGDTVIEADWLVLKPLFGAVAMPCLRAYVVSGTAPASVPTPPTNALIGGKILGHTLLSNVAKVDVIASAAASSGGM